MEILLSKAQRKLPELIRLSRQGETIILLQGRKRIPVAKFIAVDKSISDAVKSSPETKSQE